MARKDKHFTKKGLIAIIVSCLCALIIYLVWGKGSLYLPHSELESQHSFNNPTKQETTETPSDTYKKKQARLCLLNNGKCQVLFMKNGIEQEPLSVQIEAIPHDIVALESVVFRVYGANFSDLSGRIVGLNMDMGETIVRFNQVDDLLYEGRAIMASCTEEIMQYRMYLSAADSSTEVAVDFDAKRKE